MANVGNFQRLRSMSTGSNVINGPDSSRSGVINLISGATTVTLPLAIEGLYFKFFLTANITSATALVLKTHGTAKIGGLIVASQGANLRETLQAATAANNTILTIGSSNNDVLAGSYVDVFCDGTNWHVNGHVAGDNTDITASAFSS